MLLLSRLIVSVAILLLRAAFVVYRRGLVRMWSVLGPCPKTDFNNLGFHVCLVALVVTVFVFEGGAPPKA